jgi:hypothetical protein
MMLLTPALRHALLANSIARRIARRDDKAEPDPAPLVKLFNPISAATWLATELDGDGDTLFGLADLGFGCPELGSFSLRELASLRLPFGFRIERDIAFATQLPLSAWTDMARQAGSIIYAEIRLRRGQTGAADPDPPRAG